MLEFRKAVVEGLAQAMDQDPSVYLMGEDVAVAGGVFKTSEGLLERFGPDRVIDTPISELALAGAAFGSALTGKRPVVEIMFGDFMALAMDSLINQAAKWRFVSGGQCTVPITVVTHVGAGGRFAAIHSQNPGTWLASTPGLKVVCPATPADALSLVPAAIADDEPVVVLEHKRLLSIKGDATPSGAQIGQAAVVREGSDVTLVSILKGVHDCLAAADALQEEGVSAEVVDLRALRPLDIDTVAASIARTGYLVCVEEGARTGGWASGLAGQVAAAALHDLDDVAVVTTPDTPTPFSPPLEDAWLPDAPVIVDTVKARLGMGAAA